MKPLTSDSSALLSLGRTNCLYLISAISKLARHRSESSLAELTCSTFHEGIRNALANTQAWFSAERNAGRFTIGVLPVVLRNLGTPGWRMIWASSWARVLRARGVLRCASVSSEA